MKRSEFYKVTVKTTTSFAKQKTRVNFLEQYNSGGKNALQQGRKSNVGRRLAAERKERLGIRKGKRAGTPDISSLDKTQQYATTTVSRSAYPNAPIDTPCTGNTYRARRFEDTYAVGTSVGRAAQPHRKARANGMILDISTAKIFIRPGYTDLRKAVNGLSGIVEQQMLGQPFSGSIYIFCNKDRKLLKALWWDKNGFWLSQKRLEQDKFPWPQDASEVKELTGEQLTMLLSGIDFFKAHTPLHYTKVA